MDDFSFNEMLAMQTALQEKYKDIFAEEPKQGE